VTNAPAQQKPDRPKPISGKVREAIDIIASGKNVTQAAEAVGISREHLSRQLSRPHVTNFIYQKTRRTLAIAAARAGEVKVDLLGSANAMVADRASSYVLGLAGIQPATQPSVNLNVEIKAGYVIDLSEPNDAKVIDNG
jgi:phage terminase small subunit